MPLTGFCLLCGFLPAQIMINEYSVSNLNSFPDNYSQFEDWFELYNAGPNPLDIGGYFLSDDTIETTKWEIPAGTVMQSHTFIRCWASGRDDISGGHYHTNFRLTQTKALKEHIVLSDIFGNIIDHVELGITQKGHSRGRSEDGGQTWGIFVSPTPGTSNNSQNCYSRYAERPLMSDSAGFYTGMVTVGITSAEPDAFIHYTLDGKEPVSTSPVYEQPLVINTTTVLKARVISTDPMVLPGLIEFNTFFIDETYSLVVISSAADQLLELLNGNASLRPQGSIEYFNTEGVRTTTAYGEFNEHGQDSWVHPQRSIDYVTRDECGYNYALQEDMLAPLTDRNEFQRIILRAAGDDNYPGIDSSAHMRDIFIQDKACMMGMKLDVRRGVRCIMFANGQFWGVYSIREKVNDHDFTEYYYNQDKFHIQYIMTWGSTWPEYGGQQAIQDWNALHSFIVNNDMSDPDNYSYVWSQYDPTSLVDYVIINSFVVCSDWLNWNVGWWRGLSPEGTHLRWGYTLWDEDATFGHYINYTGVPGQNPYVAPCYPEYLTSGWQDPEGHITVLNKLRENPGFDQYYINRYADLLNTGFQTESMIHMLDSLEMLIEPEMPRHVNRWGGLLTEWHENVQKIRDFITTRNSVLPSGMNNCWSLTGPYDVVVRVDPPQRGQVQINSLVLNEYPWEGLYYGGIPVRLLAIESDLYYEFDHWALGEHTVTPSDTLREVFVNLVQGDTICAIFQPRLITDSLVINEINYNSAPSFDPGDWLEFYNPHSYSLDISGWEFRDGDDQHIFEFPLGTQIGAEGYLVLCSDTAAFQSLFPQVDNWLGPTGFGFEGSGELLRLFNAEGIPVDTVHYDDDPPWPPDPDGNGPTLELIDPGLDNALPENWKASQGNGTPGEENSPVISNISCYTQGKPGFDIIPNPFSESAMIVIHPDWRFSTIDMTVFSYSGVEMLHMTDIRAHRILISRAQMPAGIYICRITDRASGTTASGRFIIR